MTEIEETSHSLEQYVPDELRSKFEAIDHIGGGSFANVYLVVDRETRQRFAMKVTNPAPDAQARAIREANAMRTLTHENVMRPISAHPNGGWFLFPLAEGTLGLLQAWGRLGPVAAIEVAVQIGAALEHAHSLGFLHRDLHVDNILRFDGAWLAADWGLSVGEGNKRLTRTRSIGGIETWTAPEQLRSLKSADKRSDLFGLGRLVQWLATGKLPDPKQPGDLPHDHPLASFVNASTRLAPDERPATVAEALTLLPSQPGLSEYGVEARQVPKRSFLGSLIMLGRDVVAEGDRSAVNGRDWSIDLRHLVVGDERALLRLSDTFDELPAHDRFVALERDGEARALTSAPRLTRRGDGWSLQVTVGPRHERLHVDSIGVDVSLEDLRNVEGRERLPQIFNIALSTARGELLWAPDLGNDLRQRFAELGDVELFERVVGLEAMRMASIPYVDRDGSSVTPLLCVDRMVSLKLSPGRDAKYRRAHVVAAVKGLGRWEEDIEIFVASAPRTQTADEAMADFLRKAEAPLVAKVTERADASAPVASPIMAPLVKVSERTGTSPSPTIPVESPFLAPVASLTSKAGTPVEPLLWLFGAKLAPHFPRTKAEHYEALMGALVETYGDFQRKYRWPRSLRPDVEAESVAAGTLWRFAYPTDATNQVGDEQLMLHRDGGLSFQRAMLWDTDVPGFEFGALAFDGIVFTKFATRYAAKLGAESLSLDLRVSTPRGAKELLALFTTPPASAEQPHRSARLRHPLTQTHESRISLPAGEVHDAEVGKTVKRLLDGIANEFELEANPFGSGGPPFLAVEEDSLTALAGAFE